MIIRCDECGKFISQKDIENDFAIYNFQYDTHFTSEDSYRSCKKCNNKDKEKE